MVCKLLLSLLTGSTLVLAGAAWHVGTNWPPEPSLWAVPAPLTGQLAAPGLPLTAGPGLHAGQADALPDSARAPSPHTVYDPAELAGLPAPVARYLQTALLPGQPLVLATSVDHDGMLHAPARAARWMHYTDTQRMGTHRPGRDWHGAVFTLPEPAVLLTSLRLATQRATNLAHDEMLRDELMRYLAMAAWYPTALLPSQGVSWQAVDEHSACASIGRGSLSVTLLFRFGPDGLIATVQAPLRSRGADGRSRPTPWQARFWNAAPRDGMQVPQDAELAWLTPTGAQPYWRGHLTRTVYEFAP